MLSIKPFCGVLPASNTLAQQTIAPPYDIVDSVQAKSLAKDNPFSFLHLTKPEIDCPTSSSQDVLIDKALENLNQFRQSNALREDTAAHYYLYQLETSSYLQTGICVTLSALDYKNNLIKKHELTVPYKQQERERILKSTDFQANPLLLSFREQAELQAYLKIAVQAAPLLQATNFDGVIHRLWRLPVDPNLQTLLNTIDSLYIADGHHRVAASVSAGYPDFMAVLMPAQELKIIGYHRLLHHLTPKDIAAITAKATPSDTPVDPSNVQTIGFYCKNQWYRFEKHPYDDLNVRLCHDELLHPLNISDPRTDERVSFCGNMQASELAAIVDAGRADAACCLYPTGIEDLIRAADLGRCMPPKSTWFEPKLADGLISYRHAR